MKTIVAAAIAVAALLSACQPRAAETASTEPAAAASESGCPDDGPRLPGTGLCVGRAVNYLNPDLIQEIDLPDGCTWTMNETMMPGLDGPEALLYRAASCNGVTTELEFAGGAQSAVLNYAKSAVFGEDSEGHEVIRIFTSDPADPRSSIKSLITQFDEPDRSDCEIQPAGIDGWPVDALVITLKDKSKLDPLELDIVCGGFGLNEGETRYWLVRQGYAWFFQLGQEAPDFDPVSMMLMRQDAEGNWNAVQ
jgi:hypothetical protein